MVGMQKSRLLSADVELVAECSAAGTGTTRRRRSRGDGEKSGGAGERKREKAKGGRGVIIIKANHKGEKRAEKG